MLEYVMNREQVAQWTLTDEEWCELCFMVFELGEAQQRLQEVLLADERPSLNQLWVSGSAVQQQSQQLFSYISQQLRERAIVQERRAA